MTTPRIKATVPMRNKGRSYSFGCKPRSQSRALFVADEYKLSDMRCALRVVAACHLLNAALQAVTIGLLRQIQSGPYLDIRTLLVFHHLLYRIPVTYARLLSLLSLGADI
jgi:hypothetical protein